MSVKEFDKRKYESLRHFYEREGTFVKRYNSSNFWERRYHLRKAFIVSTALKSVIYKNDIVLDAGCGSGELCQIVRILGGQPIGLDISKSYLRRASRFVEDRICASLDHLPFRTNVFHVVLCADVIEHIPNYDNALAELYRVCKRAVVITTPCNGIARRLFGRLFPKKLLLIDKEVGHIHILTLSELKQRLLKFDGSVICRSYHVIQPLADKVIPRELEKIVRIFEKIGDAILTDQGTISLGIIICNPLNRNPDKTMRKVLSCLK